MDDWRRDPVHDCRPLPSRDAGMIRVMWIASGLFARYVTTVYDFSPVIVSDPCERMQVCGSRIMYTSCVHEPYLKHAYCLQTQGIGVL